MTAIPFTSIGRLLLATGIAALALQALIHGGFVAGLEPVSPTLPWHAALTWLSGLALLVCTAGLTTARFARNSALALTAILLLWLVGLHLPRLVTGPVTGSAVTNAFEVLALAGGAWMLAGLTGDGSGGVHRRVAAQGVTGGRIAFAITLPVFGLLHFRYYDYVASVIPAWIPAHVFWAYATGMAHIAAGLAILSGILGRLAAILLGTMFASWVILLHIPRAAAMPGAGGEWTSLFVAIALTGCAWIAADAVARRRPWTADLLARRFDAGRGAA